MSDLVIQKTKKIWRGVMYAGLGAVTLLSCESAFAAATNPPGISGTITVHLSLPNGWIANNVAPGGAQTLLAKGGVGESSWTTQYYLPVHYGGPTLPVPDEQSSWVVFIYDEHGTRQGFLQYGAMLHSACVTEADMGGESAGGSINVRPLYQASGAVKYSALERSHVEGTAATWSWSSNCTYHGHTTENIDYYFVMN